MNKKFIVCLAVMFVLLQTIVVVSAENLLINGGFEGDDGWSMNSNWTVIDDDAYTGERSVKVNTAAAWNILLKQPVDVEPNTDYIVTYYSKSEKSYGVQLKIMTAQEQNYLYTGVPASSYWKRNTYRFNTNEHERIFVVFMGNGGVTSIDDVCLKRADEGLCFLRDRSFPADGTELAITDKISVSFDIAAEDNTINSETVKLIDMTSATECDTDIVKINDFEYEISPKNGFKYSTDYKLILTTEITDYSGLPLKQAEEISFQTEHRDFDVWNKEIVKTENEIIFKADLKNSSGQYRNAVVILKAERDGVAEKITAVKGNIQNDSELYTIETMIDVSDLRGDLEEYSFYGYIWDGLYTANALTVPVCENAASDSTETSMEASEVGITVMQNKDTGCLTVYGKGTDSRKGNYVTVTAYSEQYDMPINESVDITGIIPYVSQMYTADGGIMYDSFLFNGNTAAYDIAVNFNSGEIIKTSIEYYSVQDIEAARNSALSADQATLLNVLETGKNLEILGIDRKLFESLNRVEIADIIYRKRTELEKTQTVTAQDISDIAAYAMAIRQVSESKTAEECKAVLDRYKDIFALSSYIGYKTYTADYLNDTFRNEVIDSMRGVDYKSAEEVEEKFNESAVLYGVYRVSNISYIKPIVDDNNEFLKWDLTSYSALKDTSYIDSAVAKKLFDSIDKLKTAFFGAKPPQTTNTSNSGKSSGGGVISSPGIIMNNTNTSSEGKADDDDSEKTIESEVFSDLTDVSWAKAAVMELYGRGIINGKENGIFDPNGFVTREEFVKIIIGAFGFDGKGAVCAFEDVAENTWYYEPIAAAYTLGIVTGIEDNKFGTGMLITREEIAVIISNCLKAANIWLPAGEEDFDDSSSISDFAYESVLTMKRAGIVSGYEDDTFRPHGFATRAESAVMTVNAENLIGGIGADD